MPVSNDRNDRYKKDCVHEESPWQSATSQDKYPCCEEKAHEIPRSRRNYCPTKKCISWHEEPENLQSETTLSDPHEDESQIRDSDAQQH